MTSKRLLTTVCVVFLLLLHLLNFSHFLHLITLQRVKVVNFVCLIVIGSSAATSTPKRCMCVWAGKDFLTIRWKPIQPGNARSCARPRRNKGWLMTGTRCSNPALIESAKNIKTAPQSRVCCAVGYGIVRLLDTVPFPSPGWLYRSGLPARNSTI